MFDTVAIVGTGLIGGSIALAIKKHKLCRTVIGVSLHARSLKIARAKKAIDVASLKLEAIKEADLVVLATPVSTILALAPRIKRLVRPGCIVIDVASTKQTVVRRLQPLFPRFLGTHPLAGSEKKGIANARADLFSGSLCLVTPTRATDPKAKALVQRFWKKLGCRVVCLDPRTHDRILGFVSHLPHIVAFALINAVPKAYIRFAPASLHEMTRIAGSDHALWQDILLDNRALLAEALKSFRKAYTGIIAALQHNDRAALARLLAQAQAKREALS